AGEEIISTGLYISGVSPFSPAADLIRSCNVPEGETCSRVLLTYDGTTLSVAINDTGTGATATQSYLVNIPSIVGGNTAFAGFSEIGRASCRERGKMTLNVVAASRIKEQNG